MIWNRFFFKLLIFYFFLKKYKTWKPNTKYSIYFSARELLFQILNLTQHMKNYTSCCLKQRSQYLFNKFLTAVLTKVCRYWNQNHHTGKKTTIGEPDLNLQIQTKIHEFPQLSFFFKRGKFNQAILTTAIHGHNNLPTTRHSSSTNSLRNKSTHSTNPKPTSTRPLYDSTTWMERREWRSAETWSSLLEKH